MTLANSIGTHSSGYPLSFANDTRTLQNGIIKALTDRLHRRVEISPCHSTDGFSFDVSIFDDNGFDYYLSSYHYKDWFTADQYAELVEIMYTHKHLRDKHMHHYITNSAERLFLTWIASTEIGKYYSLIDGVVVTDLPLIGFNQYDHDLFIEEFAATYTEDACVLHSEEIGNFVLNRDGIAKLN